MSRALSILILAIIVLGAYLLVKYVQDLYRVPPVTEVQTQVPTSAATPSAVTEVDPNYESWKEFTSPTGQFKVLLPILPQHATDKIADPKTKEPRKYDMYVAAKNDGTVFMISAITFPSGIAEKDSEALLTNVVNDMLARNKDNVLKMKQASAFRNFKALDFSIENGDIILGGKAFVHNNTLYVLNMVSKHGTFNLNEFNFFVNSFDVVPGGEKPAAKEESEESPAAKESEESPALETPK